MRKKKVIVVLSGGQDSTTCLYWAKNLNYDVHAVTFDYGQRHRRELLAAKEIAAFAKVPLEVIEIPGALKGTSPLVSDAELEQYESHDKLPGGLEKTFVPMRNQLFLTIAANRAYLLGTHVIITGVSAEDFGGYPDCRQGFITALAHASSLGTFTGEPDTQSALQIVTPLMNRTKRETVELAMELEGCYQALALSHTGYDGAYPPVGKDHATLLRAKGFEEADVPDPLVLRAFGEGLLADLPKTPNYDHPYEYLDQVIQVLRWRRLHV